MAMANEEEEPTCLNKYFRTDNPAGPPMVRIYVGPERALWVLPEQLLCDRVKYFKSAFQSGFREGSEKVLELPEDDPLAFAYIIEHLMTQDLDARIINTLQSPKAVHMAWCRAWMLADKMGYSDCLSHIQNDYCEYISDNNTLLRVIIPTEIVAFAYNNTSEGCKLRAILTRAAADLFNCIDCSIKPFMDRWSTSAASHHEYLSDIMMKLKQFSRYSGG